MLCCIKNRLLAIVLHYGSDEMLYVILVVKFCLYQLCFMLAIGSSVFKGQLDREPIK